VLDFASAGLAAFANFYEEAQMSIECVTSVIHSYFDGFYAGDTEKLARVFHPSARLYSIGGDGVHELSRVADGA